MSLNDFIIAYVYHICEINIYVNYFIYKFAINASFDAFTIQQVDLYERRLITHVLVCFAIPYHIPLCIIIQMYMYMACVY